MKDGDYISIQAFMRKDLNLKGNELMVYALIYGFSKDGESKFQGSANYIADWVGITRQAVMLVLKKLVERELIIKNEKTINGVKLVDYSVDINLTPCKEILHPCKKTSHQNINETINLKETVSKDTEKKEPLQCNRSVTERFRKPTLDEIKAYCLERGNNINAEQFYDYYESKGWLVGKAPMKDWKACIRTWERNGYGASQTKTDGHKIAHRSEDYDMTFVDEKGVFNIDAYLNSKRGKA